MAKYNFSFLFMDIIFLISFIGLTFIIFDLHRIFFIVEIILLGAFVLSAVIGMSAVYYDKSWGWTFLSIVSVLMLADLLIVYLITRTKSFALIPTTASLIIAFIVSLFSLGGNKGEDMKDMEERKIEERQISERKPPKKVRKNKSVE